MSGFWRSVSSVRSSERSRFSFFISIAALISLAQTLGLVGAEALFLARFGVEHLPGTFIGASAATILGTLIYAALVGSTRNDKIFIHMLWMAALGLGAGAYAVAQGSLWALPGLLAAFFLTQAVFFNHFWTFASDYFDTLSSKRLAHLFTFGASAGGALGGALALPLSAMAPPETLIVGWALGLAATALWIRLRRRDLLRWGLIDLVEEDETSLEGLGTALRFVRSSALGRWLMASAGAMTIALFVGQYLYSEIFAAEFPSASQLAFFFGVFLLVSNAGEILLELGLTPFLIRRLGVARANLLHPLVTVLTFLALALDPRLYAAAFARLNREVLHDAVAIPVRQMTYNAISQRVRGRMRALAEGVVVYATMSLAGLLLLLELDTRWLCALGGLMGLLYLFSTLRIRDEYLRTLIGGIREGRIDVSHLEEQLASWEPARLAELWDSLSEEGGLPFARNAAHLGPILAARGVVEPLVRDASAADPRIRCTCLQALALSPGGIPDDTVHEALGDGDPEVRRIAVKALKGEREAGETGWLTAPRIQRQPARGARSLGHRLHSLLDDDDPEVRAETAEALGQPGRKVLEQMARSSRASEAVAAMRCLPPALAHLALERAEDESPEVRAAALDAVARLAPFVSIGSDRLAADLDHRDSHVRGAAVSALAATAAASTESLDMAAGGLADPSREVRMRAVDALRSVGEDGQRAALRYVRSSHQATAEAAIEVLSNPTTPEVRRLFLDDLRRRVRQAWGDMLALQALPESSDFSVRFLRAAHEDSANRNQAVAFALLRGLEDATVVSSIERALRLGSPHTRNNALEVLSNLGDRDSAHLLVLMLEDSSMEDKIRTLREVSSAPDDLGEAVDADRRAFDVWIRMGSDYVRKDGGGDVSQRDTMERLLLLREIPLFARLGLDALEAINRNMVEHQFMEGEVVVREGDPAGELYLLIEGSVHAVAHHATPEETILNTLEAPNYFGEMAILDDRPRSATIVCASDARLLTLSGDSFKDLMLQMPEISFEICRGLSTRVRRLEGHRERSAA